MICGVLSFVDTQGEALRCAISAQVRHVIRGISPPVGVVITELGGREGAGAAFRVGSSSWLAWRSETTCFRSRAVSSTRVSAVMSTRCAHWSVAIVLTCPVHAILLLQHFLGKVPKVLLNCSCTQGSAHSMLHDSLEWFTLHRLDSLLAVLCSAVRQHGARSSCAVVRVRHAQQVDARQRLHRVLDRRRRRRRQVLCYQSACRSHQ